MPNCFKKQDVPIETDFVTFKEAFNEDLDALDTGFSVFGSGAALDGVLGLGTDVGTKSVPTQVGSNFGPLGCVGWKKFEAGSKHTLAIKTDGTLWSWGCQGSAGGYPDYIDTIFGQLGLNTSVFCASIPTRVGDGNQWCAISTSLRNSFAIKTDGTLWAWGANGGGQLGLSQGGSICCSSPTQVGTLTNWAKVSNTKAETAFAIKTDGTLWAWGANSPVGRLGLGDTINVSSPVQVGTLTNWSQVSGGGQHTLAVKTDGTLWAWGRGAQLGVNDKNTCFLSPIQVGTGTNWVSVCATIGSSFAIKTDGTLWAWGCNFNGQLGLNNTTDTSSPVQVGTLTNWSKVSNYNCSTVALKTDGTLWAWGVNGGGQLGLGNLTSVSSPVQVGTATTWRDVGAGVNTTHASALRFCF